MNKIYLGSQAIVDLSGYYDKLAIDASFGEVEGQIDSLTDTVGDLDASLAALVTKVTNDYYTKTYIDTSIAALEQEISSMTGIDIVAVDSLPEPPTADNLRKIYLVPSTNPQTKNAKDEYICIDKGEGASPRYAWELIGTTDIDLTNYYTKAEVDAKLDASVGAIWTEIATLAKKSAVDASIAVLDASVSALESEVKIYGNTSITNLITCTSTAYASLTKDASTLYIVTD
jgi:hypothetical protein